MSVYVGLDGDVQVKVTAAGDYVAFDKVISGEQTPGGGFEHAEGVGGQDEVIWQMLEPVTTLETYIQGTMPAHAKRAAVNALPQSLDAIDVGLPGVKMTSHTTCYINSVKLSCEVGGAAKAAYEILGLTATASALTTASTKNAAGQIAEWFAATILFGGVAYGCTSWESTIENGLQHMTNMDAGTAGLLRQPDAIKPGNQKVSLRAEFQTPPTVAFTADRPGTYAFVAKLARATGAVLTHTVTNLRVVGMPQKVASGEEDITWEVELEASYNDLSAWAFG
jgi:hypothetical protein